MGHDFDERDPGLMATTQDRVPSGAKVQGHGPGGVRLRPALVADLATIAEIERGSFSNPWQPDTFRSLLNQDRCRVVVAEDPAAGVVGYAVLWWVLDQGELANLAVEKGHQKLGIGSTLLDEVVAYAESQGVKSLFLEVRVSNEPAYRLYSHRGFVQISVRKGYYQNPREDARILVKHLSPSPGNGDEVDGML